MRVLQYLINRVGGDYVSIPFSLRGGMRVPSRALELPADELATQIRADAESIKPHEGVYSTEKIVGMIELGRIYLRVNQTRRN